MPVNIAGFVADQFRGPNLPQIDQARRQNALGQIDLQQAQQQQALMSNPGATPEQLVRGGLPQQAAGLQNIATSEQQRKAQSAVQFSQRISAVAQSQRPKQLFSMILADPSTHQIAGDLGLPMDEIAKFVNESDDATIKQTAMELAKAFGAKDQGYNVSTNQIHYDSFGNKVAEGPPDTEGAARLAETARHNRAMESGKDTGDMDPETLDTAASVVAANPTRIRDYASYGQGGQKNRNAINNRISQRLQDSGMTANDLIQLRARAAAQPANIVKLTQQNAQIQQAEQLARANGQRVLELIDLVDQTGIPLVEGITRSARAKTGGVDAAELKSVLNSFQIETARLLSGNPTMAGVISDSARNDIQHIAPDSMSATQARRIINRLFTEMDIRQAAAQEQLQGSTNQTTVLPQSGGTPAAAGKWSIVPVQ